jgi:hypothetical protein
MFRVVKIFNNSLLLSGKAVCREKFLKFLLKCLVKANLKSSYQLFKLLSSYLAFVFKIKIKEPDTTLFNVSSYSIYFSFKSLVNSVQLNRKYIKFLLLNINKFLTIKKQAYVKLLEQSKLLFFYRW